MKGPQSPLPHLTPDMSDDQLLEAVAKRVVEMGLAVPAVFFLESTKPLSYIGSQVLVFMEPFVKSIFNLVTYDRFVALMEDRKNIEKLLVRIETLDEEAREAEKERKRQEREARRQAEVRPGLPARPRRFWNRWLRRRRRRRGDRGIEHEERHGQG